MPAIATCCNLRSACPASDQGRWTGVSPATHDSLLGVPPRPRERRNGARSLTDRDERATRVLSRSRVPSIATGCHRLRSSSSTRRNRTVRLLGPLLSDIAQWRAASSPAGEQALVFPTRSGTHWRDHDYRNWRKRRYGTAAAAVGLETRMPYDLRHSLASLLLAEQAKPRRDSGTTRPHRRDALPVLFAHHRRATRHEKAGRRGPD